MEPKITTIIFDLGGVLVDWKPEYLYRKFFDGDEEKVQWFLNTICTPDWNMEQDAGRTIAEGEKEKIAEFPEYEKEIKLFYKNWTEMFSGPIEENVALFKQLKASENYKIYALTNWSAEKWDIAVKLFPFFNDFDGVVVSGKEKTRKPFEKIYHILFDRFNITPEKSVFIDDNLQNYETAQSLGLHAIHYKNHKDLIDHLHLLHINI
ncbi:HAD family hydrolase [Lutibacter sp.]|uniref:HAD family hydrolase n=1 Tax=Lutibacter sp. TaxID=1925666 RepID=UPI00356390AD